MTRIPEAKRGGHCVAREAWWRRDRARRTLPFAALLRLWRGWRHERQEGGGVSRILEMQRASLAARPTGLLCDRLHPVAVLMIGCGLADAKPLAACRGDAAVDGCIAEARETCRADRGGEAIDLCRRQAGRSWVATVAAPLMCTGGGSASVAAQPDTSAAHNIGRIIGAVRIISCRASKAVQCRSAPRCSACRHSSDGTDIARHRARGRLCCRKARSRMQTAAWR